MHATLIDAPTLRAHLEDPRWVVVDCRSALADAEAGRRLYLRGHIPGAFYASLETELTGLKTGRNGRHPLPDPESFAQFLRGIGVGDETQLVAYDDGGDMFAARLWFLARWIGHVATAVLDGGLAGWIGAGYPLERDAHVSSPKPGALTVRMEHGATVDADAVLASLHSPELLILDARSPDRFAGQNETIDPVAGHIPGARNRCYKDNYDDRGRMKAPERLRAEFAALGAGVPERVVHQCGSGVSACVNMLAMTHAGLPGSRLYPGSWSEWIVDPSRPVARARSK